MNEMRDRLQHRELRALLFAPNPKFFLFIFKKNTKFGED